VISSGRDVGTEACAQWEVVRMRLNERMYGGEGKKWREKPRPGGHS